MKIHMDIVSRRVSRRVALHERTDKAKVVLYRLLFALSIVFGRYYQEFAHIAAALFNIILDAWGGKVEGGAERSEILVWLLMYILIEPKGKFRLQVVLQTDCPFLETMCAGCIGMLPQELREVVEGCFLLQVHCRTLLCTPAPNSFGGVMRRFGIIFMKGYDGLMSAALAALKQSCFCPDAQGSFRVPQPSVLAISPANLTDEHAIEVFLSMGPPSLQAPTMLENITWFSTTDDADTMRAELQWFLSLGP